MSHYTLQFSRHVLKVVGSLQLLQMCFAKSFCSMDAKSKMFESVLVLGRSHDAMLLDVTNTNRNNWVCCGLKGVNSPAMRLRGGAPRPTDHSAESNTADPPAKPGKIAKGAKNAPSKEESEERALPAKPVKAPKAKAKAAPTTTRTESPDSAPAKPAKSAAKPKAKSKSEDAYSVIQFSAMMCPANGF
jgi:hypothetical protein